MITLPDYQTFEAEQAAAGVSDLERSARWWDLLADVELDKINWDKQSEPGGLQYRANVYRRTAESLRIQERTGIAVCPCCHKPIGTNQCVTRRAR